MNEEQLKTFRDLTHRMFQVCEIRNMLQELRERQTIYAAVKITIGIEEYDISELGHAAVSNSIIDLLDKKIEELRKELSDALYPTSYVEGRY